MSGNIGGIGHEKKETHLGMKVEHSKRKEEIVKNITRRRLLKKVEYIQSFQVNFFFYKSDSYHKNQLSKRKS